MISQITSLGRYDGTNIITIHLWEIPVFGCRTLWYHRSNFVPDGKFHVDDAIQYKLVLFRFLNIHSLCHIKMPSKLPPLKVSSHRRNALRFSPPNRYLTLKKNVRRSKSRKRKWPPPCHHTHENDHLFGLEAKNKSKFLFQIIHTNSPSHLEDGKAVDWRICG